MCLSVSHIQVPIELRQGRTGLLRVDTVSATGHFRTGALHETLGAVAPSCNTGIARGEHRAYKIVTSFPFAPGVRSEPECETMGEFGARSLEELGARGENPGRARGLLYVHVLLFHRTSPRVDFGQTLTVFIGGTLGDILGIELTPSYTRDTRLYRDLYVSAAFGQTLYGRLA